MRLHLRVTIETVSSNQATPKLTQFGQEANLGWDCACQAIAGQIQKICRMKMQMENETALKLK